MIPLSRSLSAGWRVPAAVFLCALSGCGGSAPPPPEPVPSGAPLVAAACWVGPGVDVGAAGGGQIVLGVDGPIDPSHAPVPHNPSERLVFAQLYQTLVSVDCEGRVQPVIAESWRSGDDGRQWTFRVRPNVLDWWGQPVTSDVVAASWARTREQMPTDALVAGVQVTAVDARTLNVVLPQPADVALFARSEFAVAAGEFEGGWPVGTGAHRPKTDMPTDRPMMSSFAPASIRLEGSTPIEVRMVSGDLRDALDRGVDVLVTMDAAAIDYARAAPTFDVLPFSWSTSYLLVAPAATLPGGSPSGDSAPLVIAPPADALAALARDAVRVEARPAGMTSGSCGPGGQVSLSGGGFGAPAARVIFPSDDPLARSLAERLVALALAPARPESAWLRESVPELNGGAVRVAAVGLAADAFDAATLSGRDAAYVLPLDRAGASDPCAFERSVVARAPWLVAPVNVTRGRAAAILPLIDARASVLARVGVVGLSVDASGVLLLEHARRVPPESLR